MAFSDAECVDERLCPLGYSMWQSLPGGQVFQRIVDDGRLFERLLQANVVTGATMAFRAKYRDLILPIPEHWVHDAWISLLIAAVARCASSAEPLIAYRQHGRQQIGAWRRFSLFEAARQVWQRTLKISDLDAQAAELECRSNVGRRRGVRGHPRTLRRFVWQGRSFSCPGSLAGGGRPASALDPARARFGPLSQILFRLVDRGPRSPGRVTAGRVARRWQKHRNRLLGKRCTTNSPWRFPTTAAGTCWSAPWRVSCASRVRIGSWSSATTVPATRESAS